LTGATHRARTTVRRYAPAMQSSGSLTPKDVAVSGPKWAQIRESLGITKQAAHDFYRRRIEEQEKYLPSFTTRQLRVRS